MWNSFKLEVRLPNSHETLLDICLVISDKLLSPSVTQLPFSAEMAKLFVLLYFTKFWKDYKQ